jgi:hypothetical protein
MRHTDAKFVAHLLSDDHKQNRLSVCKALQDQVIRGRNFFSKAIIVHKGETPAKGRKMQSYLGQIVFPMDADVVRKKGMCALQGKVGGFLPNPSRRHHLINNSVKT